MPDSANHVLKTRVASFWDTDPCGSFAADEPRGTRSFFERVASYRYAVQPYMEELIGFGRFADQRLLEVGCGLGTDLRQFAEGGSRVTGLDLSSQSVSLARQQFQAFGVHGDFARGDSEHLPFADASFEVVYSYGVLHHTPDTQAAIDECYRILKPGGRFIIMLYNRRSWHVLVEPYLIVAKRRLLGQPLSPNFTDPLEVVRRYDGVGNPLGKAYTPAKVREMLRAFADVRLHFRHSRVVNGSRLARLYSRFLELSGIDRRWGFWIVAQARRPA